VLTATVYRFSARCQQPSKQRHRDHELEDKQSAPQYRRFACGIFFISFFSASLASPRAILMFFFRVPSNQKEPFTGLF
jgi:hypothetical protein